MQMQHHYGSHNEDFGFDPPQQLVYPKNEPYSPPVLTDPLHLSGWSGYEDSKSQSPTSQTPQTIELGNMLNDTLPQTNTAISRFGQVTPPRSNSASSEDSSKDISAAAAKMSASERRKRSTKAGVKEEPEQIAAAATGRKRKNNRKNSTAKEEQDDKRKQSLEKNRLAAAKCRINKKEKTEQLQRNSHEKAVHNAFLKEQVMRMKEEVQQMNALLLSHANCEGCKSPEEIQKHLSNLGNEFFAQHMSSLNYDYPQVTLGEMSRIDPAMQNEYFGHSGAGQQMLNPPLPEFDRTAEFECHTPMHTD